MPNEYNEENLPRNAPKPAPLIEVPIKPLVPEVSLLFDQDKSRSFHLTNPPKENKQKGKEEYRLENPIFPQNQLESYNSWKAKNAQALHTITGSLNRSEIKKQVTGSKMSSGFRHNYTNPNDLCSGTDGITPTPVYRHPIVPKPVPAHSNQLSRVGVDYQSQGIDDFTHRQICRPSFSQHHNSHENNSLFKPSLQNDGNLQYRNIKINSHMTNFQDAQYIHEKNSQQTLPLVACDPYSAKKEYSAQNNHASHEPTRNIRETDFHDLKSCQTNQGCCECRHGNNMAGIKNRKETDSEREDRAHYTGLRCKDSKVVSTVDIAKVSNQTVMDLYKIINLQNEQILMLQQQVKQVLQIHLDCDRKVTIEKPICHSCPCEQRPNRNCKMDSNKHNCNCNEQENLIQHKASCSTSTSNKAPKRSVGIMTTPFKDNFDVDSGSESNDSVHRTTARKFTKDKKLQQKQRKMKLKSTSKKSKKRAEYEEQKAKAQYVSPCDKKKSKDDCKVNNSQADNSFSLNESELVIKTDPEQDNGSTNQSMHIDLQDYCTSSDSGDSDSVTSRSCEDEESATEEGSSDPQLGWTFYDRVVGQVNNILKNKRTPHRQEQSRGMARNPPPNYYFDRRGDFDVENNWSKRVTFDGPPLEDHNVRGNFLHARQYHQSAPFHNNYRRGHDYRMPGNPERMQDFMMYNYGNGYANLSFSTLRFLDRNDLLPPQMQPHWREQQMLQDQHRSLNHNKTRNKSWGKEPPLRGPQPKSNPKRKTAAEPPSKLLDITALKQQPKLF